MKIAVDAMGGDYAPGIIIEAVQLALDEIPDLELVLVGHLQKMSYYLEKAGMKESSRLELVHADEVVEMFEPSTTSIRGKKHSSITVCAQLVKTGRAAALVSAGHTGAAVAATKVLLRTIPGVDRPALATVMPSLTPSGRSVVCDVGANTDCLPLNLVQFALMAETYAKLMMKLDRPRIGLLSVGGEDGKGNELTKEVFPILSDLKNVNFIGNVEGHNIFDGSCDVIVCDGFVGNVMLKTAEGLARATFQWLKSAFKRNPVRLAGAILAKEAFKELKGKADSEAYGGAPLLGIKGGCIIGHGASSPTAVKNAIRVTDIFLKAGLNEKITARLNECGVASHSGLHHAS